MELYDQVCRFYEAELPEEGEVVMARVVTVAEGGSYVALLEYGDREAMLPHSELSNRRLRSLQQHVHPALCLPLRVTRVDEKRGYIDVSKRQVDDDDEKAACEERYTRGKLLQGVMQRVGELLGLKTSEELTALKARTVWRLDALHHRHTAACDVFKQAHSNPDALQCLQLDARTLGILLEVIGHRFQPRNVKVRADVKVMCWGREGVDAIKAALKAGLATAQHAQLPIQILVQAAPVYVVSCLTQADQQDAALTAVETAMMAIKDSITTFTGGMFEVFQQPRTVGEAAKVDKSVSNGCDISSGCDATSESDITTGCNVSVQDLYLMRQPDLTESA